MKKFLKVAPPEKIIRFAAGLTPLGTEIVSLTRCLGRVLAEDVVAGEDLPSFRRSTMDGYAVMGLDTTGASASSPVYLKNIGEVRIGTKASLEVATGECCRIPTGGMLPPTADAVVMVEYTRELPGGLVEVNKAVSPGENLVDIGEDVMNGRLVLGAGCVLRPQDVGILAGMGHVEVKVYRKVRVGILSTGDELVEPAVSPAPGQIRNVNQYSLLAHVEACGGEATLLGIAPDDREEIRDRIEEGLQENDVILISGGSSVGSRDFTAQIINDLGTPGVIVHGISVRPGKPTILGRVGKKIIFGLPGHPVSAMVAFLNFVKPAMLSLSGAFDYPNISVPAQLNDNIHSRPGREDYIQVILETVSGGLSAAPIFKKSGMVTSMVSADGYIIIPHESEGLEAGEIVQVYLYNQVLR